MRSFFYWNNFHSNDLQDNEWASMTKHLPMERPVIATANLVPDGFLYMDLFNLLANTTLF